MTKEDCYKRTEKISLTLSEVEKNTALLTQTLKGSFGVVKELKKLNSKISTIDSKMIIMQKDLVTIKKNNNGNLSGTNKAMIIVGSIGGLTGIVTAFITAAQAAK